MYGRYLGRAQSNRWSAAPSALLLSSDTERSTQLATIRPSCEQRRRKKSIGNRCSPPSPSVGRARLVLPQETCPALAAASTKAQPSASPDPAPAHCRSGSRVGRRGSGRLGAPAATRQKPAAGLRCDLGQSARRTLCRGLGSRACPTVRTPRPRAGSRGASRTTRMSHGSGRTRPPRAA